MTQMSPEVTAYQRIVNVAAHQGWDDDMMLELAERFIGESGHEQAYADFLEKIAAADNDV